MINEGEKENSVGFDPIGFFVVLKEVVLLWLLVGEIF